LTLLMLTTTLFSCTGAEREISIESETEEPQSEEVSSEILSSEESSKEELSSEASSEAVSFEEDDKPRLNEDLLSDIGLTYPELVKKRGKLVDVFAAGGRGVGFIFENGYGQYFWAWEDLKYGEKIKDNESFPSLPLDKKGNIIINKMPVPKSHIKFRMMDWVKVQDLFLGVSAPITSVEIEKTYNVRYEKHEDSSEYEGWNYTSGFHYRNILIVVYSKQNGVIDLDSYMNIWPSRKER